MSKWGLLRDELPNPISTFKDLNAVLSYLSNLNLIALGSGFYPLFSVTKKNRIQMSNSEAALEVKHFVEKKGSLTSGSVKGFIFLSFFLFEPQSLFSSKHLMFFRSTGPCSQRCCSG